MSTLKRRTKEADEKMQTCNITNWIETRRKLKWRQAMRIATQHEENETEELPRGTQDLSFQQEPKRKAGRPAKRWEDDLNEFVIVEETETTQSNDLKNNDTWLIAARHVIEWKKTDKQYAQQSVDD